ncbi:MAG: DUF1206 domain-containing protein [Actinomycetes bacterium]
MTTTSRATGSAHRAADSGAVNKAARVGFLARGLVYVLIGVLALQVAFGGSERTDQQGALQKVADQPFGTALLWVMVLGFLGYAAWRFSEAAWGRRDETDEKKRTVKRIGSGASGLIYLLLGGTAVMVVTSSGSGSGGESVTAKVLDTPGGQTIVVVAGLVIVGVAVGLTVRGLKTDFEKHLDRSGMSARAYGVVRRLGQVGYIARGVVFGLVGLFVVKAAVDHQPGKAQGFDVALESVAEAPFGRLLLMLTALGLVAFGTYSFAEARYRRL